MIVCSLVNRGAPGCSTCSRAMPKSRTLATSDGVIITFAGLMSRWITPASCAVASASQTCAAHASAVSSGGGPCLRTADSGAPSMSSMTR